MALVSSMPAIPQVINPRRHRHQGDIGFTGLMASSRGEMVEVPPLQVVEDRVYVAVAEQIKESTLTLTYALQGRHNWRGRKICLLYIHQPAKRIPNSMGIKLPESQMDEHTVREYRKKERDSVYELLRKYVMHCDKMGVQVDVLHDENDSIENGIVGLIKRRGITKLIMGAASDRNYSKNMKEPKSRKALYVLSQAPISCDIWFVCNGQFVQTRESRSEGALVEVVSLALQASPTSEIGQSTPSRSRISDTEAQNDHGIKLSAVSPDNSGGFTPHNRSNLGRSFSKWDTFFGRSRLLNPSTSQGPKNDHRHTSPSSVLEVSINGEIGDQLEQAMAKAETSRQEAFEELVKRRKAEKDAIDTFHRMHEIMEELHVSLEQISSLESHIAKLQVERDNALKVAEDMMKKQSEEASNTLIPLLFPKFPHSEIKKATCNFDRSFKIGEGGYGIIYRCILRHTQVAVKTLRGCKDASVSSSQGPSEFHHEVNVLTKLRHPNLVSLIGTCPEAWILVYEYYPNGSLEDRLTCRGNTPPLSWETRIRIAAELCSVMKFLQSCFSPHIIVHGDLKPDNILLDANYVSKLSDFGICRVISPNGFSSGNTTLCWRTVPKGTTGYVDPDFCSTGELTAKSDVYAFGVILLRLLTGIPALGITSKVKDALGKGKLKDLLDRTAGDWPFAKAKKLAHLAMRCCEPKRKDRPDFTSEVWKVLEQMRDWCGTHRRG